MSTLCVCVGGRGNTCSGLAWPVRYLSWLGGYLPWPGGTYPGWGVPTLAEECLPKVGTIPPETEQHSKYLLNGGRYASCVHAAGLSCFSSWFAVRFLKGNCKCLRYCISFEDCCKHYYLLNVKQPNSAAGSK